MGNAKHKNSKKIIERLEDKVRLQAFTIKGFLDYHLLPRQNLVCLVSAMRSGSTLLKALLGQAPDVSHLEEYNFALLNAENKYLSYLKLKDISKEKIILLKRPRWFTDKNYPRIPSIDAKVIILYRDVVGVVKSLSKRWPEKNLDELIEYWTKTYESVLRNLEKYPKDQCFYVNYSELLKHPEKTTRELFCFIESSQKTGVSSYNPPGEEGWKWGKDDGSENIKKMTVQPEPKPDEFSDLIAEKVSKIAEVSAIEIRFSSLFLS